MKRSAFLCVISILACLGLSSCGTSDDSAGTSSDVLSTSSYCSESQITLNDENGAESFDGTPVSFEDPQIEICVANALGLSTDATITDEMCKNVTELDCSGYKVSTLADLSLLPNLQKIYIDNSDYPLDLKGINKALNLTSVTLKNCQLSEVDRIADLTKLEYLDISTDSSWGNYVNDYSSLSALTNLKYLDMSWTGYNAYNENSLKDASFINSLENLEELNLYETGVENYSLNTLGKLKALTISKCNTDDVLQQLCNSGSIHTIESLKSYGGSQITNDGLKNSLSKATNLKELYLDVSGLVTLDGLGELQNLQILYLRNDYAFDLPLSAYNELSKLKHLEDLTITGNPNVYEQLNNLGVTPNDYAFLNEMTSLKTLSIETYDGMGIDCFTGLNNLETLTLGKYHPFIQEVDISGIEKFKSLKNLIYSGIRFKSSAPLDDLDYLKVEEITGLS